MKKFSYGLRKWLSRIIRLLFRRKATLTEVTEAPDIAARSATPLSSPSGNKPSELPKWLAKLQNESWQAEMLISGGALVALYSLENYLTENQSFYYSTNIPERVIELVTIPFGLALPLLMLCFILHLILRGYWIGLVGLNYCFPSGIKKERINFKGRFAGLFKTTSSIEYIIKLDRSCSIMFAYSFLIFFTLLAFILTMGVITFILGIHEGSGLLKYIFIGFKLILSLFGFIYLVDFVLIGKFKKIKYFVWAYYPFYLFYSLTTFSFIYRRLYYHVVTNVSRFTYSLLLLAPVLYVVLFGMAFESQSKPLNPLNKFGVNFEESHAPKIIEIDGDLMESTVMKVRLIENVRFYDTLLAIAKFRNLADSVKSFDDLVDSVRYKLLNENYEIYINGKIQNNIKWINTTFVLYDFDVFPYRLLWGWIDLAELSRGQHVISLKYKFSNKKNTQVGIQVEFNKTGYHFNLPFFYAPK